MGHAKHRTRAVLGALAITLGLALPSFASAATTIPAASPSAYNSTPDCPVSATDTVCAWNLPVDAGNLFTASDYGECPYWAAEKYPALVLDELPSDPLFSDWNGGSWAEHAQEEGLATSDSPAAGDLAVWQPEASDPSGHVAYVEAVVGDAIIVSQMDGESAAPIPALQGSTEYLSAAALAYFSQAYDLEYVVTGDAPSTPLSYVEQTPPTATASTASTTTTVVQTPATAEPPVATAKPAAKRKTAAPRKLVKRRAAKKKPAARRRGSKR